MVTRLHVIRILAVNKMATKMQKKAGATRTKKISTQPSRAPTRLDESKDSDYLQDPELWTDYLPQPFRMIDEVLQEFLDTVWDEITRRYLKRKEEALKPPVAVKRATKQFLLTQVNDFAFVSMDNEPMLVFAGDEGIFTASPNDIGNSVQAVPEADGIAVLTIDAQKIVNPRSIAADEYWLLAATSQEGFRHFLICEGGFIQVKSIEFPQERTPRSCSLTRGGSQAVVVTYQESEVSLEVYQLPVSQWVGEYCSSVAKHREELLREDSSHTQGSDDINSIPSVGPYQPPDPSSFAKPTLLKKFTSPPPLPGVPTEVDPACALSNIAGDTRACMGTGERHLLTENYLKNRLKLFTRKRADFTPQNFALPDNSEPQYPHFHMAYWKDGTRCEDPVSILIWWKGSAQLTQYSLAVNLKNKDAAPPAVEHVWPTSARILCSRVSPDQSLLALGLENGAVVITDLKSNVFHQVFRIGTDVSVTCVEFCGPSLHPSPSLYAGTSSGAVYRLNSSKGYNDADRVVNHTLRVLRVPAPEFKSPVEKLYLRESESSTQFIALHRNGTAMGLSQPLFKIQAPSLQSSTSAVNVEEQSPSNGKVDSQVFACSFEHKLIAFREVRSKAQVPQYTKVHLVDLA